jgi:uncharacterized membrane protein YuzA (DUF378 family)
MHYEPMVIGAISFLVIGVFHPIVIKTEYYFSSRAWPAFLFIGLAFCALSMVHYWNIVLNTIFALIGFSALWGIGELKEQKKRVEKGWFPKNPGRKIPYGDSGSKGKDE